MMTKKLMPISLLLALTTSFGANAAELESDDQDSTHAGKGYGALSSMMIGAAAGGPVGAIAGSLAGFFAGHKTHEVVNDQIADPKSSDSKVVKDQPQQIN